MSDSDYRSAIRTVLASGQVAEFLEDLLNQADYESLHQAKVMILKSLKTYRTRRIERAKGLPQSVVQNFRAEVNEVPYRVTKSTLRNERLILTCVPVEEAAEGSYYYASTLVAWDDEGFCFGMRRMTLTSRDLVLYLIEEGM